MSSQTGNEQASIDNPVTTGTAGVRAWDLPTRVFHWLLVALVLSAWVSFEYSEVFGDNTLKWHRYNGYAILVLIVWRILWGFAGPSTIRFSRFVTTPFAAIAFAFAFLRNRDKPYLSHNPLAGYAILAMILGFGAQATLGLLSEEHNGTTWGPLFFMTGEDTRKWITEFHATLFYYGLLVIVAVHILSAFFHDAIRRDAITKAMITGRKPARDYVDTAAATSEANERPAAIAVRALLCLAVALAIVFGGILALGGRLFY